MKNTFKNGIFYGGLSSIIVLTLLNAQEIKSVIITETTPNLPVTTTNRSALYSTETLGFKEVLELAQKGDAEAQRDLAYRYLYGDRCPRKDKAEALKWTRMAAEQDYPPGTTLMALMYLNGFDFCNVPQNSEEGMKLLRKAVDKGYPSAEYFLGSYQLNGFHGLMPDVVTGKKWIDKSLEKGDRKAEFLFAAHTLTGHLQKYFPSRTDTSKVTEESINWLRKSAEQGDIRAQRMLGLELLKLKNNMIDVKDIREGLKWLQTLAEQGDANAICTLGKVYLEGEMENMYSDSVLYKVPRNTEKGLAWLQKGVTQGDNQSKIALGKYYFNDPRPNGDIQPNLPEADKLFTEVLKSGDPDSLWDLGTLYLSLPVLRKEDGKLISKNAEGLSLLKQVAEQGDSGKKFQMADVYFSMAWNSRNSVSFDSSVNKERELTENGIKWLRQAAEQGHPTAQFDLGKALLGGKWIKTSKTNFGSGPSRGLHVQPDPEEGIKWINKALQQFDPAAQRSAGLSFINGNPDTGIPKDSETGMIWLRKSLERSEPALQYNAGMAFINGEQQFPKDMKEGLAWIQKAAEHGDKNAPRILGSYLIEAPPGITQNCVEGLKWMHKAIELGDLQAMTVLGNYYITGLNGFSPNKEEGVRLMQQAAKTGNKDAQVYLNKLESKNTPKPAPRKDGFPESDDALMRDAIQNIACQELCQKSGMDINSFPPGGKEQMFVNAYGGIKDYKITNTYTKTIDGEKFRISDIDVTWDISSYGVTNFRIGFVKRGSNWYYTRIRD